MPLPAPGLLPSASTYPQPITPDGVVRLDALTWAASVQLLGSGSGPARLLPR